MNKILDPIRRFIAYVRDAKDELKKVTWPTRDEVTSFTMVVVVALLVISIFLWAVDAGLMYLINSVVK
ncbi:MAG: preprotein translocase subunit SecE [Spirochaetes bacterium]|nr:preprotein translocase subunit SecE [Spirochaetota bacterium]